MMDGGGEAQDWNMPENVAGEPTLPKKQTPGGKVLAGDSASFSRQFPDAARVRLDNSGIAISKRPAGTSAADAASFNAMFPDAKRVKLA